ncbi:MAG TPA: hypothetical protein VGD22_05695 [Sphingobacteriaceae bacterium]
MIKYATKLMCLTVMGFASSILCIAQVKEYVLPNSYSSGLVKINFSYKPVFTLVKWEKQADLILEMNIIPSTATNLQGGFSYRYRYNGKEYSNDDVGMEVFNPIKISQMTLKLRVMGPGLNTSITYKGFSLKQKVAVVPLNAEAGSYTVFLEGLEGVYFLGVQPIRKKIDELIAYSKKTVSFKEPSGKQGSKPSGIAQNAPKPTDITPSGSKMADDDFWESGKKESTAKSGNVIPDQPNHKNLPDFVRTTDGGYFHRGADGKFREVSAQEYETAKKAVATSSSQAQQEKAQPKFTAEQIGTMASKNFTDQVAENNAVYDKIDRQFDMYKQNFYHAEAIRNGKQNLTGLSRLEGNYSSVQELEAEFNQKYYSIRSEVNNLEQARNARLSNGVNNTFNGNSTEQAIGQGMELIGGMINSAQAAKERKEAQTALKLERDQQLAAMETAKTNARIVLRTKLVQSFPNGGTPLSSHKVTLPQVYVFAYVNDKATIYNQQALVSVSNVFPVQQYADGTYPFKTTVLNKLKGYAPGEITLVGYYGDKERAEEMRNAFINLAAKSELTVKPFTVKTVPGSTSPGVKGTTGDFWETGKKAVSDTTKAEKKADFWNN